jgi:NAD(P)-dependent dehydrogenase (short-subunit alcohol dehydrogenase family)
MPVAWTSFFFFFFFFFFTKAINQSINQSNQSFKQTGASSGIGAAVAKLFAKEGASVAATGRNEAALAALVEDIASAGGSAKFFAADVTDDAAVAGVVDSAVREFGALDILVNNAGVLQGGATDDATMDNWDFNFSVNARGPFCFLTQAIPHLKKSAAAEGSAEGGAGGGAGGFRTAAVVNVSSVNGQQSFGGTVSYCAAKAALDMVTRCASVDLAPHGVSCRHFVS